MKKAELLTSLLLVLPCRNQNNTPASGNSDTTLRVQPPTKSADAPAFVYSRIQHLAIKEHLPEGTKIHLRLAGVLSKLEWVLIERLTFQKGLSSGEDRTNRHRWK
jgi:hypothetical protein